MAMERFFLSRVIKMQYKLQIYSCNLTEKNEKKKNDFYIFLKQNRQKETIRAMERFFPSRVIKMQYKLQIFFFFFFFFF
jgi:hypothetical protein